MATKTTTTKTNDNAVATFKPGKYQVSKATGLYLDVIRAASDLYDLIYAANEAKYGHLSEDDIAEAKSVPYLEHLNAITDLAHKAIIEQLIDNLGNDVTNAKAEVINI